MIAAANTVHGRLSTENRIAGHYHLINASVVVGTVWKNSGLPVQLNLNRGNKRSEIHA